MKRIAVLLFVLSMMLPSGCALYVHVPMLRPADVNISGIHKIGVLGLPPSPDVPPQFGGELASNLVAALGQNGYFAVKEQANLQQLASQLSVPPESMFDPAALNRIGRALDVDALIFGSVDVLRIHDEPGVDMLEVSAPATVIAPPPAVVMPPAPAFPIPGMRGARPVVIPSPPVVGTAVIATRQPYPFIVRIAELQVKLQLFRVSDGRVVFLQPISMRSAVKVYPGPRPMPEPRYYSVITLDGTPRLFMNLPPAEAFVSLFAQAIPDHFVPHIVPRRYTKTIEFAKDSQADNQRGLDLARANAWEMAQQAFTDGLSKDPGNAALHYNLGIVFEALGDFESAHREYQQALAIDPKRKLFRSAHRAIQVTLAEQDALHRQVEGPPQ
jgi:hypothetical protein